MRYISFITVIFALISVSSCTIDELEYPMLGSESSDAVTVIGHITRFTDCNVSTKSAKNEEESKIGKMAIAIFPVKADGSGLAEEGCVFYQHASEQTQLIFTLDRGSIYNKNSRYAIYVFANVDGLENFGVGTTLDDILNKTSKDVSHQNIPDGGFPMIGSLGDTFSKRIDQDGNELIISPATDEGKLTVPTIKYLDPTTKEEVTKEMSVLSIPMKALYAKVNFSIKVNPNMTIEGNDPPQFSLKGYKIVNIPKSVDFDKNTNANDVNDVLAEIGVTRTGTAMGNNTINFSFYLPENLLEPSKDTLTYEYPFRGTYNTQEDKNQDGIREEDENLRQRYKSKLLGEDQIATHVVIMGQYRDHQGHHHDVTYTIHLGKDSYGDFNICRNTEYNNIITIRDIRNSNEEDGQGNLSIDHRVDIERTQPAIISLRREVLLDSHFEIRPLRIRKSTVEDVGAINAVKVQVVDSETTKWMRIERGSGVESDYEGKKNSNGESIYITDANSSSYGKRRYFTHNLITGENPGGFDYPLNDNTEVVVPITEKGECVWIYVDECTEPADGVRSGVIKVTYGNVPEGASYTTDNFTSVNSADYPEVSYTINQRKLFSVNYDDGSEEGINYYIEYEEEYLHNFDAASDFGPDKTEYEGMTWGLNGEEISSQHPSVFVTKGTISGLIDVFVNEDAGKYDFYLERDQPGGNSVVREPRSGYVFCNEIIASQKGGISKLDLASKPQSAVEYCYNKNKRNADGTISDANIRWYLPAIDEVEEIMKSHYLVGDQSYYTYSRFVDFQNKFYWSSMPAYERNYIDYYILVPASGEFYRDDNDRARATKVDYKGKVNIDGEEVDDFDIPKSGVNSGKFSNTLYIRELYIIFPIVDFTPTTQRNTTGLYYEGEDESYYQPGNKSRNDMARVRCVRKMD